jgi:DNA-binding NarL/FixJ family response regulator
VRRDASAVEVLSAIRAVAAGKAIGTPRFSAALFRSTARQLAIGQNLQIEPVLGLAELICWGLTNEEIASRLNLSEHTVKNHVHRHRGNPLSLSNPPIAW